MDNITSCLSKLFTSAINKHNSHGDESEKTFNNCKEEESEFTNPCSNGVIYIEHQTINIPHMTINMTIGNLTDTSSTNDSYPSNHLQSNGHTSNKYDDIETDARMKFFRANSP